MKKEHVRPLKYEYTVVKPKNLRRVGPKYFISAWYLMTDLIDTFNADSRKSASKFSGLGWFLLFEDL